MPMIRGPGIYQRVGNEWNCLLVDEFYFKLSLLSSFCGVVESSMSREKVDSNSKSATKTSTWINVQVFWLTSDMNFCVLFFQWPVLEIGWIYLCRWNEVVRVVVGMSSSIDVFYWRILRCTFFLWRVITHLGTCSILWRNFLNMIFIDFPFSKGGSF